MRTRPVFRFASLAALVLTCVCPARASAQWYVDGAIGGNHTHDADVAIRVPSAGLALDFHDVRFAAQSNVGRRYYLVRIGRQGHGRLGFEVELIHLKAVAHTERAYDVTVLDGSTPPEAGVSPMNAVVQEYQMTHGVNLALVNLVLRRPIGHAGGRMSLALRAGAGASFPHGETTVLGDSVHDYQYGGPGVQGAAGLRVRIAPRIAAVAEYKLTCTRPKIDIAGGGKGWTTLVSHHLAAGLSIDVTR
jgi:hypothetical protein